VLWGEAVPDPRSARPAYRTPAWRPACSRRTPRAPARAERQPSLDAPSPAC